MQRPTKIARHQLGGGLNKLVGSIAEKLKHALVMLEAELDFSDQEIEFTQPLSLLPGLEEVKGITEALVASYFYGRRLEEGLKGSHYWISQQWKIISLQSFAWPRPGDCDVSSRDNPRYH